ncbi:MAG TPA: RHS repeat-associated core domain-containing protein [Steroidobacteraceae bacterium]|nr:RHS repeat-associated core domain-containing protein [Steroidobacteraceae bacterium]
MNRLILTLALGAMAAGLATPVAAQQVAAPFTFATRYNVAGQVTGTISPSPDNGGPLGYPATRNTYGEPGSATAGLLIKTQIGKLSSWLDESYEPKNWSGFSIYQTRTFEYDNQGRKSAERVIGKDGITTESLVQYSYDTSDRVLCKVVRMNSAVFGSPEPDACVLGASAPDQPDRITKFTYDGWDQVLTEKRAVGTSLEQTYVTNTYYARGVIQWQEDANGNRTELKYDSNWRLDKRVYPSPYAPHYTNPADFNQYQYDNNGNVTIETKRDGSTITNTYDNNNRLTFKNLSNNTYSDDVSYGYDLRGLTRYSCFGTAATTSCDTSGEGETNAFDGLGNLTSRKSRMSGTTRELTYQYDTEGNRTRITHPDGVYFTYNRDGLNRVCSLGESAAAPACNTTDPNAYLVIHYSAEGRRADITRPGGSVTSYTTDNALRLWTFTQNLSGTANDLTNGFSYNFANQITALTQSNSLYNYTEANNRVGVYDVNGLNQYTQIDGNLVSHDTKGNLTADGNGMSFTYDMENHLVATTSPASVLRYDVLGRLARITVAGTTTDFVYDGDALVNEYVGAGMTRRYVHSGQVDEPLVQYSNAPVGSGVRRYLYADHQGSIVALADNAGVSTQANKYDPYGIAGALNDGRFGFSGQVWLKDLGLNYYKARIYSPKTGRFLQTDPIFYKDDMNMYAYVGQDPLNRNDPSGRVGVLVVPALEVGDVVLTAGAVALGGYALNKAYEFVSERIRDNAMQAATESEPTPAETPTTGLADAEDVVTGGKEADRVTSIGTKIYGDSPTGKSADETMKGVRGLDGATSTTKDGQRGKVEVVTLPDGSRVVDRPSASGPRTIDVQDSNGDSVSKVRFPQKQE